MIVYSTPLKLEQQQIVAVAVKILKLFKLSFRAVRRKPESYSVVNYIERSIKEGDIVFDIGLREDDYLYIIRRRVGKSGRIIAFESRPYLLQQLAHIKKILRWKNVELEPLLLSDTSSTKTIYNSVNTNYHVSSHGAIIININGSPADSIANKIEVDTLDNYCGKNNIRPSFLKIDVGGNELKLLKGGINTLKNDKPKILLKCEERLAGAQNVLETFKYLQQLGYTGFFVLDTIRIPIVNFDFNLYQNTCNNFYCNNFMFE